MRTFIGIPDSGVTGDGGAASPFGLAQLFRAGSNARSIAGDALSLPGDTLLLRGGTYSVPTFADGGSYGSPALRPAGSGLEDAPITIRSYPGEIATLVRTAGKQPLVGSGDGGRDFIAITGLDCRSTSGTINAIIQHYGNGTGNTVSYCDTTGEYVATTDNHEGIEINGSDTGIQDSPVVTFCRCSGQMNMPGGNGVGIKSYFMRNGTFSDNYLFNNTSNAYNKARKATTALGNINSVWRRCYFDLPQNMAMSMAESGVTIEHCVFRSNTGVAIQPAAYSGSGLAMRNNLFLLGGSNVGIYGYRSVENTTGVGPRWPFGASFYNNVVAASLPTICPANTGLQPLGTVGDPSSCAWASCGPNLYLRSDSTLAPTVKHSFAGTSYTLDQLQTMGLEVGSQAVAGGLAAVFDDPTNYVPLPAYSAFGPDDPASILDIRRYGAAALVERERQRALVLVRRGGCGRHWLLVA